MEHRIFHVDAFADRLFAGNPACVVPLESWLPDGVMLALAAENGVAETAFFKPAPGGYHLRWFTPDLEMDLCGHATLATAHVILAELGGDGGAAGLRFESASGTLTVRREGDLYFLDFPRRPPGPAALPAAIRDSLDIMPVAVHKSRDYVLEYESEEAVRALKPDPKMMAGIDLGPGGVVATAPGRDCDFVSRFFTPGATIFEDPVTGSAHCSLIPFWAGRLGKRVMEARQLSARGGWLHCRDEGDRVVIGGRAVTFSQGIFRLPEGR